CQRVAIGGISGSQRRAQSTAGACDQNHCYPLLFSGFIRQSIATFWLSDRVGSMQTVINIGWMSLITQRIVSLGHSANIMVLQNVTARADAGFLKQRSMDLVNKRPLIVSIERDT